jgi:hypothetical protein
VPPILHIGPPKTASRLLQEQVIPRLGRPYLINPNWSKRFARDIAETVPNALPDDVIVSDAMLGDFAAAPPALVADRLARLSGGGRVVYVVRSPEDLFVAIYRQKLIEGIPNLRDYLRGQFPIHWPFSPDLYLARQYKAYQQRGLGFFAMTNVAEVRAAFRRHFDFVTVDFDLLESEPCAFVDAFADACDARLVHTLPWRPTDHAARIQKALAVVAPVATPRLARQLERFYLEPTLKPQHQKLLRTHSREHRVPERTPTGIAQAPRL